MILVITGTHEQPFDRLVEAADGLAAAGAQVFVQYGYATRPPDHARGAFMLARDELEYLCDNARIIVTHAGPGSVWQAFQRGLIPIVAPRSRARGEHVDDHQVAFARHLQRHRRVLLLEDPFGLKDLVRRYEELVQGLQLPGNEAVTNRRRLAEALDAWLGASPATQAKTK